MPNVIPCEAVNAGTTPNRWDITPFSSEHDNSDMTSYLVEKNGRHFLCVQHPLTYANLTSDFGKVTPARLYTKPDRDLDNLFDGVKDIEVDILRNHPIQYAGLVFRTLNDSAYGVSNNYRLMRLTRKGSSDGLVIDKIAGIENIDELHSEALFCLDFYAKDRYNEFIEKNGKAIKPGRFIALTFKGEEAKKINKIGHKTSLVESVRLATAEELARYA